jgi:prolyl-tRNA synthetase
MFSDMELIGIPHRIVIGDRGLDSNTVEYRARTDSENQDIALDNIVAYIQKQLR